MVDLSTAMAAAAASDKRRSGRDGEKKRGGGKVGVEPFDPVDHVVKEKADTFSMWLVILYAIAIGLTMRYLIMPALGAPASVLWSLPLLLIFTLPPLHRMIIPKIYSDRYTFGNWFRASFLYTFTWLAVCFIVVNPPLGDISPPEIASKTLLVDMDNPEWHYPIDDFSDSDSLSDRNLALVFGVRDNDDAEAVMVEVKLMAASNRTEVWSGSAESLSENWRTHSENLENVSGVAPHSEDVPILIQLPNDFDYSVGVTYTVEITLSQDGNPWDLTEKKTIYFTIKP